MSFLEHWPCSQSVLLPRGKSSVPTQALILTTKPFQSYMHFLSFSKTALTNGEKDIGYKNLGYKYLNLKSPFHGGLVW